MYYTTDVYLLYYTNFANFFSMPAVEYTKNFITSVVVGKDVVPRIGLHQMEALRADLISAIQRSKDSKVNRIPFIKHKKNNKSFTIMFMLS